MRPVMQSATLKSLPDLFALKTADKAAFGETLPGKVRFLKWGRNDTTKGPFILDDYSAQILPLNQKALGFDRVALDFEHNTVPGTPEYERTQEPRPVAGYGAVTIVPGDGLYLDALNWTPGGQANARNYEDLSGALAKDSQDRVIFVHSVGLVRNGATPDVHLLSARALTQSTPNEPKRMPELNLDTLATSVTKLSTDLASLTQKLGALETQLAGAKAPDLTPLSARLDTLEASLKSTATAQQAEQRAQLIAAASRDGKVIPLSAESIAKLDVTTLNELVAGLPKNVVPLNARPKPKADAAKDDTLTGALRSGAAWSHLSK